jgi:FMN phosphatase YigB (HAD superfamily)
LFIGERNVNVDSRSTVASLNKWPHRVRVMFRASPMPLTLEQYATYLDSRGACWPAVPPIEHPKARAHLTAMHGVRAVSWSIYGTLVAIGGGELLFEHPQKFIMDLALDKTVQEFKMWGAMSRKPGQPSEYMGQLYNKALTELRMVPSRGEKFPEVLAERTWENILKKLLQKDYKFDAGFFGSLNEYSRKIAFFFHASLQGTACYEGAATALQHLKEHGIALALSADAQCFTLIQLQRGLAAQNPKARVEDLFDKNLRALSFETGAKKPSDRLFESLVKGLENRGISPHETLHVGSRIAQDVAPAKKAGMRTALFAGDKASLCATPEQLKDPKCRPDVLMTELTQILDVVKAEE